MEWLIVRDTKTGKELHVARDNPLCPFLVCADGETVKVRRGSMRKVFRLWMRARMEESG